MQHVMRWVLLGMAMAVAACGRPAAGAPTPSAAAVLPRDMAGCYALHAERSLYYAPPRIHLREGPAPEILRHIAGDSAWALTRLDDAGRPIEEERDPPFLYWIVEPSSPDSVRIVITTGHSGSRLVVPVRTRADTLRGFAEPVWDFGPPMAPQSIPVSLVRVPCAAEAAA